MRRTFSTFHLTEVATTYGLAAKAAAKGTIRAELLISNFEFEVTQ